MTAAALAVTEAADGHTVLALSGRLDADTIPEVWRQALQVVRGSGGKSVVVDAAGIDYCDGAGIALLVDLLRQPRQTPIAVENLKPAFADLLRQFDPQVLAHDQDPEQPRRPAIEELGHNAAIMLRDMRTQVEFLGHSTSALFSAIRHPSTIRWRDVGVVCERAGADALPIVALISFLLGLILAFQSAIPMRKFGAEIFVADLIGLAMVRELGALMTAILLAGRSGAAFAAEIGTMRVNQEIDALTTMGLDPVRFLVTTRVIAAVLMTPLLTLFAVLVGLLGGALTMRSFGIPFITFLHEVESIVTFQDFMAGWVKSFVFALLIAGIGCLRGLQTGAGASAVGDAATRAVVSGLVLIVIVDGVFAVLYFILNI
ncbi:MAG: MlaE family lipid ABC transporter permease subunit [Burkholderiales bacterium]|nr:MlaE family lipid ABC transporter permease subunit [Burkholderiales bacterium]